MREERGLLMMEDAPPRAVEVKCLDAMPASVSSRQTAWMGPRGVGTAFTEVTDTDAWESVDALLETFFASDSVPLAFVSIGEASGMGNARSFAISLFADLGCINSVFILASCVRVTGEAFAPEAGEMDAEPTMSC